MNRFASNSVAFEQRRKAQLVTIFSAITLIALLLFGFIFTLLQRKEVEPTIVEQKATSSEPRILYKRALVAVREIQAGEKLVPTLFRIQEVPEFSLAGYTPISEMIEANGKYAKGLLLANQPLLSPFVTLHRNSNELGDLIPKGYRAVTITVDARTSVEGHVQPNSQVDVSWIFQLNGLPAAMVLIENAKVLSVERSTSIQNHPQEQEQRVPSTITLQVATADMPRLQLALSQGTIYLSMRGTDEVGAASTGGPITITDLLGIKQSAEIKKNDLIILTEADGTKVKYTFDGGVLKSVDK